MRYTVKHLLNTDSNTYWEQIYFDPDFNEKVFKGPLGFRVFDVQALDRKPDGSVRRRVECISALEVPAIGRKFFGDSVGYVEDGTLDPKTRTFHATVHPKIGAEKIHMRFSLWLEPRGDKRVERVVDFDCSVKIFGIGKLIEGMIEKETRASYDIEAKFTNQWISDKGL